MGSSQNLLWSKPSLDPNYVGCWSPDDCSKTVGLRRLPWDGRRTHWNIPFINLEDLAVWSEPLTAYEAYFSLDQFSRVFEKG